MVLCKQLRLQVDPGKLILRDETFAEKPFTLHLSYYCTRVFKFATLLSQIP